MVCFADVKLRRLTETAAVLLIVFSGGLSPSDAHAQAVASAVTVSAPLASRQYPVRNGDTLDRVIAQTLGNTPFSTPFLREVFARLNPQSLPQGPKGVLLAGTVLVVPDACTLRQMAFADSAADCADRRGQMPSSGGGAMTAQERAEEERRHWVRYP